MIRNRGKILMVLSFLTLLSLPFCGVAVSQSIPFETIDQGETSYFDYGDPSFLGADMVITDQQTWAWFWAQHASSLSPPPSIPDINFKNEMILVTMLGFQTSGSGPSIAITSIEEIPIGPFGGSAEETGQGFSRGIQVFINDNRRPGTNQVITNPYHIVKTERFISVVFQHQSAASPCSDNTNCPCTKNGDCSANEFCLFPEGQCSGSGVCTLKATACPLYCLPLCGCDSKTYCNACEAYGNGVSILHNGPCQ